MLPASADRLASEQEMGEVFGLFPTHWALVLSLLTGCQEVSPVYT